MPTIGTGLGRCDRKVGLTIRKICQPDAVRKYRRFTDAALTLRPAELSRGDADQQTEVPRQVALVGEACGQGDLR